jgi:hypothetical protein
MLHSGPRLQHNVFIVRVTKVNDLLLWQAKLYFFSTASVITVIVIVLTVIVSVKAVRPLHHQMIQLVSGCGFIAKFVGGCWAVSLFLLG